MYDRTLTVRAKSQAWVREQEDQQASQTLSGVELPTQGDRRRIHPSTVVHAALLNRAVVSQLSSQHSLLQLQRQYGNRYVQQVVRLARQPARRSPAQSLIQRDETDDPQPSSRLSTTSGLQFTPPPTFQFTSPTGFQLSPPTLTVPGFRSPALSLGVGQLQLNPTPFQSLPLFSTVPIRQLLQPSPEMLQRLVEEWMLQYRLRQPTPALPQSAWTQIWSAWRRLTNEWIARGEVAIVNPAESQDLLRQQAAEAILRQLTGGEPPQSPGLSEVAGQVWPAFEAALNATQFYPALKQRASELAVQHWPMLVTLAGGAVATSLTLGIRQSDWRSTALISGFLPSLVDQRISVSSNLDLVLRFGESTAIGQESGVVVGLRPTIGLRWDFGSGRHLLLEGDTNLRFQTGQDRPQGFQFNWAPGLRIGGSF